MSGVLESREHLPALRGLFRRYGLTLRRLPASARIPGSYWGEPEAGLTARALWLRDDTPVHSVLHEGAHYVCLPPARRQALVRDAGGDDAEENAVCYLQILLSDLLPGVGRERMCADMDAWGYSFRLGSAGRWFREDAAEAAADLRRWGLLDAAGRPRFTLRGAAPPAAVPAGRGHADG